MHDTTAPTAPVDLAERRCWRCLHMFPGDPDRSPPVHAEFWLCEPCAAALLPSRGRTT